MPAARAVDLCENAGRTERRHFRLELQLLNQADEVARELTLVKFTFTTDQVASRGWRLVRLRGLRPLRRDSFRLTPARKLL